MRKTSLIPSLGISLALGVIPAGCSTDKEHKICDVRDGICYTIKEDSEGFSVAETVERGEGPFQYSAYHYTIYADSSCEIESVHFQGGGSKFPSFHLTRDDLEEDGRLPEYQAILQEIATETHGLVHKACLE